MSEQVVQTYITWTHGAQPTWLQFHGPGALLDRPIRQTTSPPPPPSFPLRFPPPPPPPPPPPVILHPPQYGAPRSQLLADNPALPHRNRSAHAARSTALTIPVMKSYAVQGVHPNDVGQHPLLHRGDLGGHLPCSPPNVLAVHRCPHRQIASITVMPSCAMGGNVFPLVIVDDQDIIIAGARHQRR